MHPRSLALILCTAASLSVLLCQSTSGLISGTIRDSSGASVAECSVVAVHPEQEAGMPQPRTIPVHSCSLAWLRAPTQSESKRAGFRSVEQTGVVLDSARLVR